MKKHIRDHMVNEKRQLKMFWQPDGAHMRLGKNVPLTPCLGHEVMEDFLSLSFSFSSPLLSSFLLLNLCFLK
jgi:hypothetical protein